MSNTLNKVGQGDSLVLLAMLVNCKKNSI